MDTNQTPDNPPAFPFTPTDLSGQIAPTEPGMTLRDYFAGQILSSGVLDDHIGTGNECGQELGIDKYSHKRDWPALRAKRAYAAADAMLAERSRS